MDLGLDIGPPGFLDIPGQQFDLDLDLAPAPLYDLPGQQLDLGLDLAPAPLYDLPGQQLDLSLDTQPVLVLRFEAKTEERLEEIKNLFYAKLADQKK